MGTDLQNKHSCPTCGLIADATTGLKDSEHPQPGSLSICIRCLHVGIFEMFAGRLAVRPVEPDEYADYAASEKWGETLARLEELRADRATKRHFMATARSAS